jgi:hypothetical protein
MRSSHVRTRRPGWRVRQAPALRMLILLASLSVAGSSGAPALEAASDATDLQKTRTFHTPEAFARETGGAQRVDRGVDAARLAELQRAFQPLPSPEITVVVAPSPTLTWIGTREGAVRLDTERGAREYFAGLRWLPDDHVTGIATAGRVTWIETPRGFARLEDVPMTLEEKSRAFVARVQARHTRWGLTADSLLKVPGDLSSNQVISTDNDGLWTAIYVAAECFRYAVTGAADARDNARAGMQAILRLEAITGIPGFPARSFIRVGVDLQPGDGEWHDTPDGLWRWKGDTSSDEIVGHYFVYPIYYDLVADEAERRVLASTLARITDHILDNGYQLIDVDGQRTRWGFWAPEAIWEDPDETGLRALHMLSHLRVALHMAPSPAARAKYQAAYDTLIGTHRYHLLTRNQKIMVPGAINHSDDQLAFLSYYPLLRYEKDTQLVEVYRDSLDRSWRIERPERNPLWNVIYAVGTEAETFDRAESVRTLREIPMDQVQWTVRNSHRRDVPTASEIDRHGRRQALVVLPYDELPMSKWNGNPYRLDGGHEGRVEDDGAYFLLPYWMGRYHRLFE